VSKLNENENTTSTQVVSKLRSGDIVGENNGDSREQVRRYVRLTYLVPGLLEMVDSGKMPFVVGVELSYLNTEEQLTLAEIIKKSPSLAQASELKQLSKANILTAETIKRTLFPPKEPDDILDFEDKYEQLTLDDVEPGREKKKAASSKDKNINALVDELKKKHCATVHNWSGDENQVMKGYILKAFNMWNLSNPEDAIPKETLDNLMQALRWATDDLTAEQAYEYYMTH